MLRERHIRDRQSIPLTHRDVRVRCLGHAANYFQDHEDGPRMARMLERVAKRVGGFTGEAVEII